MSENRHITRIVDTLANALAGMDSGQTALLTDQKNEHIHRISSNYYFPAMSKYWNGAAYTYLDSAFDDLDIYGDLRVTDDIQLITDATTKIYLATAEIGINIAGTNFLQILDDTQDKILINSGSNDIDFDVYSAVGTSLFVQGSSGNIGIGTAAPTTLVHAIKDQNATTTARVVNTTSDTASIAALYAESNGTYKCGCWQYSASTAMDVGGLTATGMSMMYGNNANGMLFVNKTAQPFYWGSATNTHMKLDTVRWSLGLGVSPSAWASGWRSYQLGARGAWAYNSADDESYFGTNAYWDTTDGRWEAIATADAAQIRFDTGTTLIDFRVAGTTTANNPITWLSAFVIQNTGAYTLGLTSGSIPNVVADNTDLIFNAGSTEYFRFKPADDGLVFTDSGKVIFGADEDLTIASGEMSAIDGYSIKVGNDIDILIDNTGIELIDGCLISCGTTDTDLVIGSTAADDPAIVFMNDTTGHTTATDGTRIDLSGSDLVIDNREQDAKIVLTTDTGTVHVFGGHVRSATAEYRRYYHMPLFSSNPGGSGATYVAPSANSTGGYQIDAASEILSFEGDVHSDWDGASDIKVEISFEVNVNNTGGGTGDTVDLKLIPYYKGNGETSCRTQTVEVVKIVGQSAQYKQFTTEFTINYDEVGNVIAAGDKIGFLLNIETDTSEVDNIIVTSASMSYNTTHAGIESTDV